MANAQITFTQGASTGGAGVALMGTTGSPVTVSNGDDAGVDSWKFELLDAGYGSALAQGVVQDGDTPTWSFTPDVAGGYVVRLTTVDDEGNIYVDTRVFGVPEDIGSEYFVPPFLADAGSMNFKISVGVYNAKGWSPYMATWLRLLKSLSNPVVVDEVNVSSGGQITYSASGESFPDVLILHSGPGSAFGFGVDSAQNIPFALQVYNATADLCSVFDVQGNYVIGEVPSGGSAWLFCASANSYAPATTFLSSSVSAFDTTTFQPSGPEVAPCTANISRAQVQSYQTTPSQQTVTIDLPLPGTAGSDIPTLPTPGLYTIDIEVAMQSTTTLDAALFRQTWGWTVASPGSPASLGASAISSVAIGNSVASPNAVPSGWGVVLQLDGTQQYAQVVVTGDPSLTVNCRFQPTFGQLQ